MKKYRSFALICALALTVTGCKAQSIDGNLGGAASAPTFEASADINEQTTTAATTIAETTTEATAAEPEAAASIALQSYTVGNALAEFTFDAPEGLEFEAQSSAVAEQVLLLLESYTRNDTEDYTIGVLLVDFDYTLGQPQELLDYLGFSGDFYIRTEFSSQTTENGTAYDYILMDLYNDEAMQSHYSTGIIGCFPMESGVLFFGYEMTSQDYFNTAQQTIASLVINESTDATESDEPDTELPDAFQMIVCEDKNCSFPVLKELEYFEHHTESSIWSGFCGDEAVLFYADYSSSVTFDETVMLFELVEGNNDTYKISVDYETTYGGVKYAVVQMISNESTYYERYFAVYDSDIGSYSLSYSFTDECDAETKALIIESFKGFKILE